MLARVRLPFLINYKGNTREIISGLEAYSYNLVNGKVEKTKLEKKHIYDEKITDNISQIKFAIPNVKEGSVIEYKYKLASPFYYSISDWVFQKSIPVQNGLYEISIPEYFIYNVEIKGYERVEQKEMKKNERLTIPINGELETIQHSSRNIVFTVSDLPAMKDENYIWNVNDFKSLVRFELSATSFPGSYFKPYSKTWEDIEKTIKESTDFVRNITRSTPFKDEIKQFKGISDEKTKIEAVYNLIKQKIRWDGSYAFTGNPGEAIKNGTGNNVQINGALISALTEAGIKAYPALIRRRSQGRLPITFPSLEKITTFVVIAESSDGTKYCMDGSAVYGGLDMLPSDLLVDRARTFDVKGNNDWIDLSKIGRNQLAVLNTAAVNENGDIHVKTETRYYHQPAYGYKTSFNHLKDSAEYIDNLQHEKEIEVEEFSVVKQKDYLSPSVIERFEFTKKGSAQGDFIYINPLILPHTTKNNFTQSERKLPIEFEYPYSVQINTLLTIPEGYTVEEMPKSERFLLPENAGTMSYLIEQKEDRIQLLYRFQLNEVVFPFTSYPHIREFWGKMVAKNGEMIVLKKK